MQEIAYKMPQVTVAQFFAAGQKDMDLHWEANAEYAEGRVIEESALNRPGLALAGFMRYFANRRIQVIGLAETSYLKSLPMLERMERLKACGTKVPAWVMTRGRHLPPYLREIVDQSKVPIMRTGQITGDFMNDATVLLQNMTSPTVRMAGTMVEISGVGVLLQGPPGIGKSEIALALIERGHSLVADDTTILRRDSTGHIMCTATAVTQHYMEIRGLGLIHVPNLFGVASMRNEATLDLIIQMEKQVSINDIDRTGLDTRTRNVLGLEIPLITVPVAAGRDLTHVVEVAALNQRCKRMGYDSARELDEKLKVKLARKD